MTPDYIIVQAGGKGTRLGHLTANRPKALVPIGNLPMIFYLFRQFPNSKFIIIADYKAEVMHQYLAAFAEVQYLIVNAHGAKGTCSGISLALAKLPPDKPFMLVWSDLILSKTFSFPQQTGDYIGLSHGFLCRWRYHSHQFEEIPSSDAGVAGLFLFHNKTVLEGIPEDGEFVRWLQQKNKKFKTISLEKTEEFGLLARVEEENNEKNFFQCRPFNQIIKSSDGKLIKKGIDAQGELLADREKNWYRFVSKRGFQAIPIIYNYEPLTMQQIQGKNVFEYSLDKEQQNQILYKVINCLRQLHSIEHVPVDYFSIYDAYIQKTWKRIDKVRDLIPFSDQREIIINGKKCHNIFFYKQEVEKRFSQYSCDHFTLLHGDNTFSNMMLDQDMNPVLIDPRGYFGHTEFYGDPVYDWAKLYYSIVGNYDQFNRKHFLLDIDSDKVRLSIQSNGWESIEEEFFHILEDEVNPEDIKLIHAIIWLSLTTYAWEDYDSICGAFYNGLYYLEDIL
ncbi:MAG: NTP transferase domain-containing protein [Lachnospiraceae bacterium]|jgi:aminoglycoside phosphotransferase|nr:NTP transferase domain-containing protein [Lachnospiraceae bacterium]